MAAGLLRADPSELEARTSRTLGVLPPPLAQGCPGKIQA